MGISNVGIDFNYVNYQLSQRSSGLASLTPTGSYSQSWGDYTFVGDGSSDLQVFQVNEDLTGYRLIFQDMPSDATVVVNIAGSNRQISFTNYATGAYREHIVYNFHEASDINLSGEVDGSVLIPDPESLTTITGNVHGRLLTAGDVDHSGSGVEVHNYPFAGNIPDVDETPFPVELISFEAEANGNNTDLSWITASEINNHHFEIQRATQKMNFETIALVNGSGNSNKSNIYHYTDKHPETGKNYYRLKQVDFDGEFSFSEIATIRISPENELSIFPNPATDMLNITTSSKGWLEIRDQSGSIVRKKKINTDSLTLNLSGLANGIYIVIFRTDNDLSICKLIME